MTDKIIDNLHEILKKHICTMKRASLDDSKTLYMSDSMMRVIHFDKIPNEYSRGKGWHNVPKSNDALYISVDEDWFFIEFKNGSIDKANIFKKIYDSLIMLMELGIIPDFQFIRDKMNYILVYNSEKFSNIPESKNRSINYTYFLKLAKSEEKLFDIDKFEKFLFKETHTYSKELFKHEFINYMEEQERIALL